MSNEWVGAITQAGADLMTKWTGGGTLSLTHATAGEGTVSDDDLAGQTDLAHVKQTVSIVSGVVDSNRQKIKIQITASNQAYTLNQIGLWAKISDSEPVLLALFQNADGIPIPSSAESPYYLYTFYGYLAVSNQGEFSLTVDPAAFVTYGTMQEYVSKVVNDKGVKFIISDTDPGSGPVLWFDTGGSIPAVEETVILLELGGEEDDTSVVANIDGEDYPVKNLSEPEATQTGDTYQITVQ